MQSTDSLYSNWRTAWSLFEDRLFFCSKNFISVKSVHFEPSYAANSEMEQNKFWRYFAEDDVAQMHRAH